MENQKQVSPNWSRATKIFICVVIVILIALALWQFQVIIWPVVVAGIVAYLLNPLIVQLDERTPLSRGAAIGLVYGGFGIAVATLLIIAGVTIYQQSLELVRTVQEMVREGPDGLPAYLSEPLMFSLGGWEIDLSTFEIEPIMGQIAATLRPVAGQSAQFLGRAATATAAWLGWALLTYVLSIYFAVDLHRLGRVMLDAVEESYQADVERLMSETGDIWNNYLRGQVILALLIGTMFLVTMWFLGVQYAVVLAILAALLDFIPYFGPATIVTLSAIVAGFQPENWLGLHPFAFGLLVFAAGVGLQQIEANILIPRIIGGVLRLHPILVMVGAIMGGLVAGVLGTILAAPTLATIQLLGIYTWRKLLDLDPFPDPAPEPEPEPESAEAVQSPPVEAGAE